MSELKRLQVLAIEYNAEWWAGLGIMVGIILFLATVYVVLRWVENSKIKVSNWWWLLPIFLNILGGIMMFIALRKENYDVAKKGLIMGFIITAIEISLYILIIISGTLAFLSI